MKLQSIEVDGFGVLADMELSHLDSGLNVIYGSNGSGKSTLLQFLRGVCCGYSRARKQGLLPPVSGGSGGGALRVRWDGDVCRFTRTDAAGPDEALRVTLLRNDLETPHPRFVAAALRLDLVPLLFAVGAADVHNLHGIVRQAVQDGIPLVTRPENLDQLTTAAEQLQGEQTELVRGDIATSLGQLGEDRDRLQAELDQLADQLRHRCQQWEQQRPARPVSDAADCARQVTWLRAELAAAETDLREAEDLAWMPQPPPRTIIHTTTQRVPQDAAPSSGVCTHLETRRSIRLRALDRRIDHARTLLAEAARARLDINLRAARIAGSEDTPAEPFIRQVRDSLKSLEVGLVELRDESDRLSDEQRQGRCVCEQWQSSGREAVAELSRRLYQLCEHVSRYELRHRKSVFAGAQATISECELSLLQSLESLRSQRRSILEASGDLREWQGSAQATVEHAHCECFEHDVRLGWTPSLPSTPTPVVETRQTIRTIHRPLQRPTSDQLARLRQRVETLRGQVETAVVQWRSARLWKPTQVLPEDIRALERQIDDHRMQLMHVESELVEAQQRWRVLTVTCEVLRRVIEDKQRQQRPQVIQWASDYLQRLTDGRYTEVRVTPVDHDVEAVAIDGTSRPTSMLSRGTLDQVALSLRLALVRAYAGQGIRFPLVLDDVLVDTDHLRLQAAVSLLADFSRSQDQQIVYLTCQTHLADLFELHGFPIHVLAGSVPRSRRVHVPNDSTRTGIHGWVDRKTGLDARPQTFIASIETPGQTRVSRIDEPRPEVKPSAAAEPGAAEEHRRRRLRPLRRRQPGVAYWLSPDAPLDLVPSVGSQMGRRLVGLNVRTVGDLIELDINDVGLRLSSLQITPERLRRWQAEAELLCCVPDLTGPDAQLLVACGILDGAGLADANVDELLRRFAQLSESERQGLRHAARPSRDTVQRWIYNGRRARTLQDVGRHGRRQSGRRLGVVRGSASRSAARSARAGRSRGSRRASADERRAARSGRLLRRRLTDDRTQRSSREDRVRDHMPPVEAVETSSSMEHSMEALPVIKPFVPGSHKSVAPAQDAELRFYLSLHSPVVDAPSIGPTTARRLEKIGVITVADLLHRPAADIAARLKNRRVKEDTVLLWQQQSRLMCRIPLLRGHDAQVLVACGITEPEQVAALTPAALFEVVGPFVESRDGQRLLRSSKTPDLDEVTDWINWARQSRHLRAA